MGKAAQADREGPAVAAATAAVGGRAEAVAEETTAEAVVMGKHRE